MNGTLYDTNNDGLSDGVVFYFPAMWNMPDNSLDINDNITLEVVTVVANVPTNSYNVKANSVATLSYNAASYTSSVQMTVLVPTLTINKAAVAAAASYPEAGTIVNFTVTINNPSPSAPAYTLVVTDTLSVDLSLIVGSVTATVGTVATGNNDGDSTVMVTYPTYLVNAATITIKYAAYLTNVANASKVVTTQVSLNYLTAPAADYNIGQDRALNTSSSASITMATPATTIKIVDTSFGQPLTTFVIGQTTRMLVNVTVPQGTSGQSVLLVQLPSTSAGKIQAVSSQIIYFPANMFAPTNLQNASQAVLLDTNNDNIKDTFQYTFGNLLNVPDGVSQGINDTIVVEAYVVMINDPSNAIGDQLTTTVNWNYNTGTQAKTVSTNIVTAVLEPQLTITKTPTAPTYLEAGAIVNFTITISQSTATYAGTAFNMNITDLLTPNTPLIPGSVSTTSGTVTTGNGPTDTFVYIAPPPFLKGVGNIVIKYAVQLLNTVQISSTITNTAYLSYTSIPPELGLNNTRNYAKSDTGPVTVASPTTTAVLNSSSVPITTGSNIAIGEVMAMVTTFTVPQGTMHNSTFTITVPKTSDTYRMQILSTNITYMASNFQSSRGLVQGALGGLVDTDNDGYLDTSVFSFGALLNVPDGVSKGPNDVITILAMVMLVNAPTNTNNQNLNTFYTLSYATNGVVQTPIQKQVSIKVVEPVMTIAKSGIPTAYPEAGDVVTYTVTISHTTASTGPAYNTIVTDVLIPQLLLVPGTVTVSGGQGGSAITGNQGSDTTVVVSLNPFVRADGTVTITYKAAVTNITITSSTVVNRVSYTFWSSPDDLVYNTNDRRSYSNYATYPFTMADPVMFYFLNSSSIAQSGGTAVAIGEVITLTTTLVIPQGTTHAASLSIITTPSFPGYMTVLNGNVTAMYPNMVSSTGIALGYSSTPVDSNADGITDTIVFNFGDLLNLPEGKVKGIADNLTVTVDLIVSDTYNYNGLPLNALATFLYNNSVKNIPLVANVLVQVATPTLAISKTSVAPSDYLEAGTVIPYTINVTATVQNTAVFGGVVTDILPPTLQLQENTLNIINGTLVGFVNNTLTVLVPEGFTYGNTLSITYSAVVANSTVTGTKIGNTASALYFSAPAGSTNIFNWTISSSTSLNIASPSMTLRFGSTSFPQALPHDVVVGSTVSFSINVVIPQGTTNQAVLNVTLPNGRSGKFSALSSTITHLPSNIVLLNQALTEGSAGVPLDSNGDSIPDVITFTFGDLINYPGDNVAQGANDTITIQVKALVIDFVNNTNLGSLLTTAVFTTNTTTINDNAIVRVVTPALAIQKVATPPSYLVAGSIVNYTMVVAHNASSNAAAYNISVYDPLNPQLTLMVGSVSSSSGTIVTGNHAGDVAITLTVDNIPLGTNVTITYRATVTPEAKTNSVLPNTATLAWASAIHDSDNAKDVRFYGTASTASIHMAAPSLSFTLFNTSNVETTGSQVSIGEKVLMFANVTFTPGSTYTTVVKITLPTTVGQIGATLAQIQYVPPNLSFTNAIQQGLVLDLTDTNGDTIPDTIIIDFGNVTNFHADVETAPNATADQVSIAITGLVMDYSTNTNLKVITSSAVCTYSNTLNNFTITNTLPVTVVEPILGVTKTISGYAYPFVEAGNTVLYSLAVIHVPTSKSAAFNINVTDFLSPGLQLVPGSVKTRTGSVVADVQANNTVLVHPLTYLTTMNPLLVITYNATITTLAAANSLVNNTVGVEWSSSPTSNPPPPSKN